MAAVTAEQLSTLRNRGENSEPLDSGQAELVIGVVTAQANGYTRGRGFTDGVPNDEIAMAVILPAADRMLATVDSGHFSAVAKGPESVSYGAPFAGWTVAELFVLDRYRVKAVG